MERVLSEEMRPKFSDTRPDPSSVRREVDRAQRADLSITMDPRVSLDPDYCAVE